MMKAHMQDRLRQVSMVNISVRNDPHTDSDKSPFQADAIFPDGRDYHARGKSPYEALRVLANFWETQEKRSQQTMGESTSALYLLNEEIKSLRFSQDPIFTDERYSVADRLEVIHSALSGHQEDRTAEREKNLLSLEAAYSTIKYLLPLAKGYVHANPGIRSTENIIEDAEAVISQHQKSGLE